MRFFTITGLEAAWSCLPLELFGIVQTNLQFNKIEKFTNFLEIFQLGIDRFDLVIVSDDTNNDDSKDDNGDSDNENNNRNSAALWLMGAVMVFWGLGDGVVQGPCQARFR